MPNTTRGFRYPAAADPPNVPLDMQELAEDIDGMYIQTTIGTRPAAGKVGRVHRATDTGQISLDTGAAWVQIGVEQFVCTLHRNSEQSNIPNNTWTAISFDGVVTDPLNARVAGTPTRLIVPKTGTYVFTGSFQIEDSDPHSGLRILGIRKSDGTFLAEDVQEGYEDIGAGTAGNALSATTAPEPMNANQYVELVFYHTNTTALDILGGDVAGHKARLGCHRVF